MKANAQSSAPTSDEIEFPMRMPPLAVFFVAVPILTIIFIVMVLVEYRMPLLLKIFLFLLGGSCIALIREAFNHLGAVTIQMSGQELIIKRMLGRSSYSWSEIEQVKLVDPGASFSDSRHDEGRAGIGLFLRDPEKKVRAPDAEPDVILLSRSGDDAGLVIKACERIATVKRMSVNGRDPKRTTGLAAKPGKSFRKTQAAA